jgi:DNA-binding winged helix-turn-helix (wHTH) protein
MPETGNSAGSARFGFFSADLRTGELRKHGRKIRLTGRPFQILAMLLERPGELLTREEIRAKLWPADTFVDFEHGMNTAVRKLRDALGDSAKKPRFVETLPRRGYRFIARVEGLEPASRPSEATSSVAAIEPGRVGQVATVNDAGGGNFLLLPIDEEALAEKEGYESAKDDLGIALMAAAERLLLVPCGTKVKILEARQSANGCRVRILEGRFIGAIAFAPRKYLQEPMQSAEA